VSFIPYDIEFPAHKITHKPSFYEFLQNELSIFHPLDILYYHMCISGFLRNHTKSTWTQNAQNEQLPRDTVWHVCHSKTRISTSRSPAEIKTKTCHRHQHTALTGKPTDN